jgi:small subunit ribosomal protein S21
LAGRIVRPGAGFSFSGCERRQAHSMIKVRARGNENVEQMLKRFKKLCEKEGLNRDIKRNSYYEKPSERKRRAMRKSRKTVSRTRD